MSAPRALVLAALFTAGSVAGAGAVALASSTSSPPPRLVTGLMFGPDYELTPDGAIRLTVDVFNPSDDDLPVTVTSIAGWPVPGEALSTQVLSARSWTPIEVNAVLDCAATPADFIELDAGSELLDVSLEPAIHGQLSFVHGDHCGSGRQIRVETEIESVSDVGDGLRIDLRLLVHGRQPIENLQINDARTSLPGSSVALVGLPAELGVDGSIVLTTRWTVFDACVLARQATPYPNITFATDENFALETSLGERGVAVFTRYAAAECAE